jgi:hypothetical protein
MKGLLGYGLLGLAAFLIFLSLTAPATLLTDQIGARLPGFGVQAVEGTATEGAMLGASWRGVRVERLSWRWRPLALLAGRLEFRLNADDPEIKLTGNAALGLNRQTRVRDLVGRLPLTKFGNLAGSAKPPLDGLADIDLSELVLSPAGRPLAARGAIRIRNLRAALGQPLNLGDHAVQLDSPQGAEGVRGQIKDSGGPLALEATLNLLPDGRYRLTGQAGIRDPGNPALRQAMSLLGPPGSDGRWALNFSGALAP